MRVWDEEVYNMEVATTTNIEIFNSLDLPDQETLVVVSHDVSGKQKVKKSKLGSKLDDVLRAQPGFEVSTK